MSCAGYNIVMRRHDHLVSLLLRPRWQAALRQHRGAAACWRVRLRSPEAGNPRGKQRLKIVADAGSQRRSEAAQRTCALRWLAVLWKQGC
jgi:hypothetical protein